MTPPARPFGATNQPRTCLWCGRKLRQHYIYTGDIKDPYDARRFNVATGHYGYEGNDLFCSLRCGEEFGKAAARLGTRFERKPKPEAGP